MFKWKVPQEVAAIKTPHERLIEFLEKRGLKEEADSLRNGGTTLELGRGLFNYWLNVFGSGKQPLGMEGAKLIAEVLKTNGPLISLGLVDNAIGDKGAKLIAEALKTNDSLTSLSLAYNSIGNKGAKFIIEALKINHSITSLCIHETYNSDADYTIKDYLDRNRYLASDKANILNTGGNNLYSQKKYSEAIEKYKAAIKITKALYSSVHYFNGDDYYQQESYERDRLYEQNKLYEENKANAEKKYEEQKIILNNELINNFFCNPSSLNICYQEISDELAKLIAEKLKNIKTTTTVNFSGSQLNDKGIKVIIEALKTSKQLEKLGFSCSNLGDQKISILAEILQISTLTHIYLGENDIGIIGIKAIIEASKFNNNIVHLDLHNNNMSNEGAKLIAEFLTNNRTLKHLDISGNKITLEVVKAIIEALRENTTITHIDLEQDNIDNTSKTIIEKYLQRNKNLMSFQELADGINDKVATNVVINAKDKAIIKDTIEEIIHKAKELNTTDIDKITASMQELIVDKSTKLKLMIIENQLNEIIDNQNITDDISVLGGDFVPAAG